MQTTGVDVKTNFRGFAQIFYQVWILGYLRNLKITLTNLTGLVNEFYRNLGLIRGHTILDFIYSLMHTITTIQSVKKNNIIIIETD